MKALLAGLVSALVAAGLWAAIALVTDHQYGLVAIAVGLIVGISVRFAGHGTTVAFALVGAGCSLLAIALGNLLAVAIFVAQEFGVPFLDVLAAMDFEVIAEVLTSDLQPLDYVFYGIALYEGLRFSVVRVVAQPLPAPTPTA